MNTISLVSLSLFLFFAEPVPIFGQNIQRETQGGSDSATTWEHIHGPPNGEAHLRLERALRCSCGCLLDLHLCQAQMQCETSLTWSRRIVQQLEQGESEEAILAGFTSEFGASVLLMPPFEGFSRVGYLLPWAAILTAGGMLAVFFWKGVLGTEPHPRGTQLSPAEWEQVREELDRMKERERDFGF